MYNVCHDHPNEHTTLQCGTAVDFKYHMTQYHMIRPMAIC